MLFITLIPPLFSTFLLKSWHLFSISLTILGSFSSADYHLLEVPPRHPLPTCQSLSWFPTIFSFWPGSMRIPNLLLSCSSKLVKQVFTRLPGQGAVQKLERRAHEHQPPGKQGFVTRNPRWKCTPCVLFCSKTKCFCLGRLFVSQVTKKPLVPIMCHYGGVSRDSAAKVNLRCII